MKNLAIITILCLSLVACTNTQKPAAPEYTPVNLPKEEAPKQAGYYCPMKCEGEKVYDSPRYPCPECEMKLIHTK